MPQQPYPSVENNFTKGLITEATGLNFPGNAATATTNCEYTLVGDVIRRQGIDFETNGLTTLVARTNVAMSSYIWRNASGTGQQSFEVMQIGSSLYFYNITSAAINNPLSRQLSSVVVALNTFTASGGTFDPTQECQFSEGNGYLFVFHPSCDPFYCSSTGGNSISATVITLQIRDFLGITSNEGPITQRPASLSLVHDYNLINQGWVNGAAWSSSSTSGNSVSVGLHSWVLTTGLPISNGDYFYASVTSIGGNPVAMSGSVASYDPVGGLMTAWVDTITGQVAVGSYTTWSLRSNSQTIPIFQAQIGLYPSNADIWYTFKDSTGLFSPGKTFTSNSSNSGYAPRGHCILNVFSQDRSTSAGVGPGLQVSSITTRPTNGAWFQGRVWYAGVSAPTDSYGYNWTETVYFSQIALSPTNFGLCYQQNDPTAEVINTILPTDGGTIYIQGCGGINKLFPIQNGMLVFANNGIWFITGNTGIGFTADDYTVTKLSSVKTLSGTSFVDVLGLPYFWNEDAIYQVVPGSSGQLAVEPLTVGTIQTFYSNIPNISKYYVRGAYDPINYVIKWVYKTIPELSVTDRYQFDGILNFNTFHKSWYPYSVGNGVYNANINGINYITYPVITTNTPDPGFKYPASWSFSQSNFQFGFADEHDTSYVDWATVGNGGANFVSRFITGYRSTGDETRSLYNLPKQAWRKIQVPYLYVFSRNNGYAAYYVQSIWDYGANFDSNNWSQPQFSEINDANSSMFVKRHKIRGRGRAVQFMFTSVDGQPFDFMGWSVYTVANTGN